MHPNTLPLPQTAGQISQPLVGIPPQAVVWQNIQYKTYTCIESHSVVYTSLRVTPYLPAITATSQSLHIHTNRPCLYGYLHTRRLIRFHQINI